MKQPKALLVIFFTEMWERFSFYGMRALLILYLIQELFVNMSDGKAQAIGIFSAYGSLVYASPFLGGLIADRYLGHRKAVILGAILMMIGHFAMAIENETFLYIALSFLILGNGFFKPNLPILVSGLYSQNDPRRDGGFTLYYMGVNLGAFLSPILCGIVGETYGWGYGFTIAGVGMVAGLFVFLKFGYIIERHHAENGTIMQPEPQSKVDLQKPFLGLKIETWIYVLCFVCVGLISFLVKHYEITSYILFPFALSIIGLLIIIAIRSNKIERDRLFVILILIVFDTLFWAFYEQAGSSLTLYAQESVNRNFGDISAPASLFQSLNPMYILIFATPLSFLWVQLAQRKKEPSTPHKFAIGIFLLSLGFLILGLAPYFISSQTFTENGEIIQLIIVPALFLAMSYLFQTIGELCLSPIGLSMVSRLAPARIVGMVIGAWYLSSSMAFQVGGWIANLTVNNSTEYQTSNDDLQESTLDDAIFYDKILESDFARETFQSAINVNYASAEQIEQMTTDEKRSFLSLLQYTKVFVTVGLIALLASVLLFLLAPRLRTMMHE